MLFVTFLSFIMHKSTESFDFYQIYVIINYVLAKNIIQRMGVVFMKKNIKHSILIVAVFVIMSAVIGDVVSTFFISEKYTSESRYQIINRNSTQSKSSKKDNASKYMELFTCDEFMEIFTRNCSLDYNTAQLSKMTKFKPVKKTCWFDVLITCESKSDAYVLQQTFEYSAKHYSALIDFNFALVSPAEIPKKPSIPNIPFNIFVSAVIGFLAGCITLLILPKQQLLLETDKDVKNVTDIPVLTQVPVLKNINKPEIKLDQCHNLFFKNSFNELLDKLKYVSDSPCCVITVCSPSKGDGKTTVAVNLAIAAAMNDICVLLLDGNFRDTSFKRYFNIEDDDPGFADIISGRTKLKDAIKTTDQNSLFILPSGNAGIEPAGTLLLSKTNSIISKLKPMFDMIIIDTPAVRDYSDVMTFKEITNAFVLTIDSTETFDENLSHALKSFELSDIPIKGIVVNKIPARLISEKYNASLSEKGTSAVVRKNKKQKNKNEFINMKI